MNVHLRNLRYALAVAQLGSFTHAAEALFITQPSLSRQVRKLEEQLHLQLFNRSAKGIIVTEAGQIILDAARAILESWDDSLAAAQSAHARTARVLRVGFNATGAGPLTTKSRVAFSQSYPDVLVQPKRLDWGSEVDALREGVVDVAFVWLPAPTEGVTLLIVAREPRIVGLPVNHRLADHDNLRIIDLRDEPLLWTARAPREWVDWWAVNPRPDGSAPIWGPLNDNVEEMLEHVAARAGICFAPASMAHYYARSDIVWRPLLDVDDLEIAVGYLSNRDNHLAQEFARIVCEQSEICEPPAPEKPSAMKQVNSPKGSEG